MSMVELSETEAAKARIRQEIRELEEKEKSNMPHKGNYVQFGKIMGLKLALKIMERPKRKAELFLHTADGGLPFIEKAKEENEKAHI